MTINLPNLFWPIYSRWPHLPFASRFRLFGCHVYLEIWRAKGSHGS